MIVFLPLAYSWRICLQDIYWLNRLFLELVAQITPPNKDLKDPYIGRWLILAKCLYPGVSFCTHTYSFSGIYGIVRDLALQARVPPHDGQIHVNSWGVLHTNTLFSRQIRLKTFLYKKGRL